MDVNTENKKNATFDPWTPQPPSLPQPTEDDDDDDVRLGSKKHIALLEKKLKKVQGKSREPTSKDMLACLSAAKDAHLKHLVNDSVSPYVSVHDYVSEDHDDGPVAVLQRRLYPDRQALSPEELDILTQNDILQQVLNPSGGSDVDLAATSSVQNDSELSSHAEKTDENKT